MSEIRKQIFDGWKQLNFSRIIYAKGERKGVYRHPRMGCDGGDDDPILIAVDLTVLVDAGLLIEFLIRENGGFVGCTVDVEGVGRAKKCFAGWSYFCDLNCAASRYFISITSPSMISLTSS